VLGSATNPYIDIPRPIAYYVFIASERDFKRMEKEITIYDIAAEAGVSASTVSRVLTNNARVSACKRDAVLALIDKYHYRPNTVARRLVDPHTHIIGVIVADIRNPYYANVVVECEKAAIKHGYLVMLCNTLNDDALEVANLQKLYDQRVDAIIQIGSRVDDLVSDPEYVKQINRISRTTPFIISAKYEGADCYSVYIDDTESMRLLFEHLVSFGHRDIAMIGGYDRVRSTHEKRRQYIYQMGHYGIPLRDEFIIDSSYSYDGGYMCMNQLLSLNQRPTAIIAINDFSAVGVMRSAGEHGLIIPHDMSIVSFDNTFLSEGASPHLTSIDYDYPALGETLIDLAVNAINGECLMRETLITPKLIVRESCKQL
jgi:DNA-binding LacI/PurR family transcriptional regulator